MKIIGFATKFYTLWDYEKEVQYSQTADYKYVPTGVTHKYMFFKNISTDLEKVKQLYPNVPIDENLRGKDRSFSYKEKIDYPTEYFPFGKLEGSLIMESDDLWQLNRTYEGSDLRRRVLARKRLIELGELVRFDWVDTVTITKSKTVVNEFGHHYNEYYYESVDVKRKYIEKSAYEARMREQKRLEEVSKTEYLHNVGDKVVLSIKEIKSISFDTNFGTCFIITYISEDGNTYYYKGGRPSHISKDAFTKVQATIKHDEYKGEKQTILQRIKILDK